MLVALGMVTIPLLTLPILAVFGFLLPLININVISLLRGTTPSEMRGRVMGMMGTVVLGLIPFSQGLSGVIIDAVNQQVPTIYMAVGGAFIAFVLLAATAADFRRFLATDYTR